MILKILLNLWSIIKSLPWLLDAIIAGIADLKTGQDDILRQLDEIKDILRPSPAVLGKFTVELDGVTYEGFKDLKMRDDQKATATVTFLDKKGKPAPVDGIPVWASSDETVLAVTPAEDGMTASVAGVAPGTARVSCTADADLGAGTTPVTLVSEDIPVTAGTAVAGSITLGTPEDQ